jgi:hypothetical protein
MDTKLNPNEPSLTFAELCEMGYAGPARGTLDNVPWMDSKGVFHYPEQKKPEQPNA